MLWYSSHYIVPLMLIPASTNGCHILQIFSVRYHLLDLHDDIYLLVFLVCLIPFLLKSHQVLTKIESLSNLTNILYYRSNGFVPWWNLTPWWRASWSVTYPGVVLHRACLSYGVLTKSLANFTKKRLIIENAHLIHLRHFTPMAQLHFSASMCVPIHSCASSLRNLLWAAPLFELSAMTPRIIRRKYLCLENKNVQKNGYIGRKLW